jgi:beta-glucosidase
MLRRWQQERCVGNVGSIPRLGFRNLCMQDSPLGVRFSKLVVFLFLLFIVCADTE